MPKWATDPVAILLAVNTLLLIGIWWDLHTWLTSILTSLSNINSEIRSGRRVRGESG